MVVILLWVTAVAKGIPSLVKKLNCSLTFGVLTLREMRLEMELITREIKLAAIPR